MADPRCPRCDVPLHDQPDYCWSCGYYVGDRWRLRSLAEGEDGEPRIVEPDETPAAPRPVGPVPEPHPSDLGGRWMGRLVGLAVVVIVLLVALVLLGGGSRASTPSSSSGSSAGTLSAASAVAGRSPSPAASGPVAPSKSVTTTAPTGPSGPTGPTTTAEVVRIVDGDTIIVSFGGGQYRVRYIGMDTPESVKPNTPVERMAKEAAAENERLVDGRTVILERDVSETDQYGRLLRNVWVERDGTLVLVGLELVREGFAQVTTFPPDVKYVDELLAAERAARDAGIGLWAGS